MRLFELGVVATLVVVGSAIAAVGSAKANGFGENQPWQFATPSDRNARAAALDLEERKKGGYYDGFQTTNNILNENYNCVGAAPNALANENTQLADAVTSSPDTGSTANTDATSTGNQALDSYLGSSGKPGGGQILNDQTNQGQLNSEASSSVNNTTGNIDASGGQSNQDLNSDQNNSGTITAMAGDGNVGCNFNSGKRSGGGN